MKTSGSDYPGNESRELARLVGSIAVKDGVFETDWPGLLVSRASTSIPRQPVPYKPSLCIVVQGQKRVFLGDRAFVYNPLQYLVAPVALPLEMEIPRATKKNPVLGLGLELDLAMIRELLLKLDVPPRPSPKDGHNKPALYISRTSSALQDALIRLLGLLSSPTDLRILGSSIVREILFRVLQAEQGGQLQQLASQNGGRQRIARLIGFLNENYQKRLSIGDIARIAGMSASTLHHRFREMTSMSPLQYLKKIRLHQARLMMVNSGLHSGEAAYQVGYESPSQFSREFKRLFGVPPSRAAESLPGSGPSR